MAARHLGWLACLQAFAALVITMSFAVAVCASVFGWFTLGNFAGFISIWLLSIILIPLRIIVPFLVCWIVLRRYDYIRPLYFMICGVLCAAAAIVTFPAEQAFLLPKLNVLAFSELLFSRWLLLISLLSCGGIGGLAAWSTARRALSFF